MKETRVGFIGLGNMGSAICTNIQKAGFPLNVYNRTKEKTAAFIKSGASLSGCPREVAENSDLIFTSLMDDASVLNTCAGEHGLLAGLAPDKIHVGLTTISPQSANKLEQMHKDQGSHYIAGPVVGRPDVAAVGELITFLAGNDQAIESVREVVSAYTKTALPVGESPSFANALKICVNYMVMTQLTMLGEVYAYAEKSELDKDIVLLIATMFYGGSGPMVEYAEKIKNRDFEEAGFTLLGGLKDALIFEQAFLEVGARPGLISIAKDSFLEASNHGLGDKDWSALTEISRWSAGLDNLLD